MRALGLNSKKASMGTTSSPVITTINVYRDDLRSLSDMIGYFHSHPSNFPQVHRAERRVQKISVLAESETPLTVAPMSVDMQRGLGPVLSQLPGELRNHIYSYLLSTGHPQFLRASKALYLEGSALMAKDGIYRMSFGMLPEKINYLLPSQRIVDTIHNLDIRVNLSYYGWGSWAPERCEDLWLLRVFGEPGYTRGRCSVTIEVYPSTAEYLLARFCMALRLLSDFETVVVRAEIGWLEKNSPGTAPPQSLMDEANYAWFERRETDPVPWSVFKFQYLYDHIHLTLDLGKPRLEQDESGLWLVFHPRKALEKVGEGIACKDWEE